MQNVSVLLIIVQGTSANLFVEHVHLGPCELPSAHALLKEEVQFSESPAGRFWDTEVCVDDAEEADSGLQHVY